MGIAPLIYTEALEQQLALARAVSGPLGEAALGRFGEEASADLARIGGRSAHSLLAGLIAHAQPYFWCAPLVDVLAEAARTIPEYTFTRSSFPTSSGFVWLEQPVPLQERLPGELLRTELQVHE